jgi:hypothetical protein
MNKQSKLKLFLFVITHVYMYPYINPYPANVENIVTVLQSYML